MPTKKTKVAPKRITVELTLEQLTLVTEALDSHIYWQLSDDQYRNNGYVNEPGSDDEEAAAEIREAQRLLHVFNALKEG